MGRTKDAIAEGLSIATAAARLTIRNHLLVETIARGGHFDGALFAEFARQTLRLGDLRPRPALAKRALDLSLLEIVGQPA